MKSTLTRIVFALLALGLIALGLWVWYQVRPAEEPETMPESQPAVTAASAYQAESLQSLRDSLEALRTQMYRNEAALRYELTSTYQRIAVLEQKQQESGGDQILKNVARRLAEVSRLYATHGLHRGAQLLSDTSRWLQRQPEFAVLAAQLADDARSVREWNAHYQSLNGELERMETALQQLPGVPQMDETQPAGDAAAGKPGLLDALRNFVQGSFALRRQSTAAQPLQDALTLEIYRVHARLLLREMRFAATQRAPAQLTALKRQLLGAIRQFPPSPARTDLEQMVTALTIPTAPAFEPLAVEE